jgi:hypothetical protein
LEVLDAPDNGTRWEMVLQCAFGYSLMFTEGLSNTARTALHQARELADGLQDVTINCERSQVSLAAAIASKTSGVR